LERPLTEHIRPGGEPLSLTEYEELGGYQALRQALGGLSAAQIIESVKTANLKGRGGAGFPTAVKWSLMPTGAAARHPTYLVANADEMEPGTFKDRFLIEGNPHQLIEGMIIAAYAVRADVAYIFLRWAYKRPAARLERAVREAYDAGYLGRNILGTDFSLEMFLHASSGRYMCGEETGLLNSLEGKRAIPRAKPPYPQISGLFGRPTLVNNVETFCCVPHIINKGPEWFLGLSRTSEGGTKVYGISGRVKRPGIYELPMGTTLREILEEHAGGMLDGYKFRGLLPGGASTDFQVEEHLDVMLDFSHEMKSGSRLGTGTIIVLDDRTCPVGFVLNLETFFARESCGWCTPCREGLPWVEKTLRAIEQGRGEPEDLALLEHHVRGLSPGHTYCALAPGAMEPLQSALKYFRGDFERHITDGGCPWE
jgi:NADH-quinone oxidoreductase subunit F